LFFDNYFLVGEGRCIQGFGMETGGSRPFERPRHRWEDNIEVNI
jgi:hypothetical protein